jgi:hypothetical protein
VTEVPQTVTAWAQEIRRAQRDAAEAMPFGALAGVDIEVGDLFHLAPVTALKARGLPRNKRNLKRATDAALVSYVATTSNSPELKAYPTFSFAFAYLASHFGLGLLSESEVAEIMDRFVEEPSLLLKEPHVPQRRQLGPRSRASAPARRRKGRSR